MDGLIKEKGTLSLNSRILPLSVSGMRKFENRHLATMIVIIIIKYWEEI